jgi:hypothetical protein
MPRPPVRAPGGGGGEEGGGGGGGAVRGGGGTITLISTITTTQYNIFQNAINTISTAASTVAVAVEGAQ